MKLSQTYNLPILAMLLIFSILLTALCTAKEPIQEEKTRTLQETACCISLSESEEELNPLVC